MNGGESVHELTNLIDGIENVRSGESEVLKGGNIRYSVASERGAPSYAESFEPDARGVGHGLESCSASKRIQGVFSLSQD